MQEILSKVEKKKSMCDCGKKYDVSLPISPLFQDLQNLEPVLETNVAFIIGMILFGLVLLLFLVTILYYHHKNYKNKFDTRKV